MERLVYLNTDCGWRKGMKRERVQVFSVATRNQMYVNVWLGTCLIGNIPTVSFPFKADSLLSASFLLNLSHCVSRHCENLTKCKSFSEKSGHRIWPQKLDIFVTNNGNKYLLTSFFHCIFLPTVVDIHTSCTFFSPSFLMHYVIRGIGFSFCAASLLREFPLGLWYKL